MSSELYLSDHLRFVPGDRNTHLAYHKLFGNVTRIDRELYTMLSGFGSVPYEKTKLTSLLSKEVFHTLYQAHFLVHSKDEERKLIQKWLNDRRAKLKSGAFLEALQISTSNKCNFACSYCFADTADRRSSLRTHISKNQPTITFETAKKAIDQTLEIVRKHKKQAIGIKFLGREPLVNWAVITRLLEYYREAPIEWAITTNGSLLTDEIAGTLKNHGVQIVVSLDGTPAINNKLRVLHSGAPTYNLITRGMERLAAIDCPFSVSSVVSSATQTVDLKMFIDTITLMGATELELTLVMQTTHLKAQSSEHTPSELAASLADIYYYGTAKGLFIHGDWIDPFHRILSTQKLRDDSEVIRTLGAGCAATSHQISLESSGDLFPCRAMSLHYGHVDNLEAALQSQSYEAVAMRTFYNVPFCNGCELEGMCQGTCLGSCEESNQNIYVPQHDYCDVYRAATEMLLKNLAQNHLSNWDDIHENNEIFYIGGI